MGSASRANKRGKDRPKKAQVKKSAPLKLSPAPAKLTAPRPASIFIRERLFHLLDRIREDHPVIWISAPAGSGKTSLAASYLHARKLPALWYQVDAGDGDIASFFYYMGLAVKYAAPRYKQPMPLLTPEYLGGIPTFTRNFFREVFRRLPKGMALVLDNYQDAPEDSQLHDILHIAMSEVPHGMNLLVLSRVEPPSALARLRLCEHAACLDWEKMRLTPEETEGISALRLGKHRLDADTLNQLHERAAGWTAGVVLILEQSRGGQLTFSDLPKGQHLLFDYFAGEILNRSEPHVREFLLKTALFPKVSATAARELTGLNQAEAILEELTRRNYFTVRHAGQDEDSYEYHPLFRDFLRAQLKLHRSTDEIDMLHRKAAELAEQQGDLESAVELYTLARDWAGTARLLIAHARTSVTSGRGRLWLEWLELIPEEIRTQMPWLLYWSGICRIPFDVALARAELEQAFNMFRVRNDFAGVFLAWSGVVHSLMHALTRVDRLDPWIARLDELSGQRIAYPTAEIEDRVASNMFMALVLRQPQHPQFGVWRDRATRVLERSDDPSLCMFTLFYLFTHSAWEGDLARMEYLVARFRAIGAAEEAEPLAKITVKMAETWSWMSGRTEESMVRMEEGLALARQTGVHLWDYLLMIQGTVSALTSGAYDTAGKLLARIAPFVEQARGMDKFYYYHDCGWLALERGNVSQAIEFQQQAVALATETAIVFGEAQAHFGMSQLYHEAGSLDLAHNHLATARKLGAQLGSPLIEFMSLIAEAQYTFDRGDESEGIDRLRTALALGRERNYANFTYWRPLVLSRLCARALEYDIEVEYVQALIKKRRLLPPDDTPSIDAWPFPVKLYTLGRFSLLVDDKPLNFSGKSQKKPIELLKALIAFGGRDVLEGQITDLLWPEADGDAGHSAFTTTMQRLRKTLGNEDAILIKEGKLALNPQYCYVDVWAFERLIRKADELWKENKESEALEPAEKAAALYKGSFLGKEGEERYMLSMQERLRSKFIRCLARIGNYLEKRGEWEKAVECYQKGIEVDNLCEEFYQSLMLCYQRLGLKADAITAYNRCCNAMTALINTEPSAKTKEIYSRIIED